MSPVTFSDIPKITIEIFNLERDIEKLKWWQVYTKIKYQIKLTNLRSLAWDIGFQMALKDLEKEGWIKKVEHSNESVGK